MISQRLIDTDGAAILGARASCPHKAYKLLSHFRFPIFFVFIHNFVFVVTTLAGRMPALPGLRSRKCTNSRRGLEARRVSAQGKARKRAAALGFGNTNM